jgi:hypothetical protein
VKRFFSEEKKQKTFLIWAMGGDWPTPQPQSNKSFLVLFFKKELLAFP